MIRKDEKRRLQLLAANIRKDIVIIIGGEGHVGHLGGSCSSADILAVLYGAKMRFDPENPSWEGRDKLIYSKGHAAIAQYAAMAEVGYFPKWELAGAKSLGSRLQGHPDRLKMPGIEAGTGSLGQGLSIANGMAMAMKLNGQTNKVYCVLGDGELAEGQVWEAAMTAKHYKLDNVVAIIDQNGLQATGTVAEQFDTNPLPEKWRSFGWHVILVDGHDVEALLDAFEEADRVKGQPTVLIAETVKGKGISFAENVVKFHNGALTPEQYQQALRELDEQVAGLLAGKGD